MLLATLIAALAGGGGELELAAPFSSGMVLQRESRAPLWGRGRPGSAISVRAEWADQDVSAVVDGRGAWRVELATPAAGGPFTIRVRGERELVIEDVLVGEVWLCSGQSNMEWRLRPGELGGVHDAEAEIAAARFPRIRHFDVVNTAALEPRGDVRGRWVVCDPSTVGDFSAVAYYFARELERELDVPIGLINATWSGTRIEAWLDESTVRSLDALRGEAEHLDRLRAQHVKGPEATGALDPQTPTALFNGMIAPLAPYAVRGFLWYQGESNRHDFAKYARMQPALVERWRELWGGASKPFYYVQIAPFAYPGDVGQTGAMRDVQRACMRQANTGMVSTMDIGDPSDIHPRNKKEVGRRLALWARAETYGERELVHCGPMPKEFAFEGDCARIVFEHVGRGLVSGGDHLTGFEVAGADRKFHRAQAVIEGDSVLARSGAVPEPIAVRYGFAADAQPILFNEAWLPAAAFRSDAWAIE